MNDLEKIFTLDSNELNSIRIQFDNGLYIDGIKKMILNAYTLHAKAKVNCS